ncbi:hypothetical protein NDU88_002747 [Pleurodeles waltl]|uniref:Uncharacterized protein n=1 Tax=Pleurodeles waltl TaxID=8319 RepID=A0AAV7RCB7_PLEWA|nr:hypothetical protein NDU88_002747 [Pleurodeles waltl]
MGPVLPPTRRSLRCLLNCKCQGVPLCRLVSRSAPLSSSKGVRVRLPSLGPGRAPSHLVPFTGGGTPAGSPVASPGRLRLSVLNSRGLSHLDPGGPEAKTGSSPMGPVLPPWSAHSVLPSEPLVQDPRARRRHPAAPNPLAPRPGSPPARTTVFSTGGCTGLLCRRLQGRAPFNRRSRRPRRSSWTTRLPS